MKLIISLTLAGSFVLYASGPTLNSVSDIDITAPAVSVSQLATPGGEAGRVFSLESPDGDTVEHRTAPDGTRYAALRFQLAEARSLRLHFRNFLVPQNAVVFVYTSTADGSTIHTIGPLRNSGIGANGDFWTPAMNGRTVTVELQYQGDAPASLPFTIDAIAALEGTAADPLYTGENPGETMVSMYRGHPVIHEVRDGMAIMEGDVLLGKADELLPVSAAGGKANRHDASAVSAIIYRWPGGVIPYVIDPLMVPNTVVVDAIAHWNSKLAGVISLIPRTNESAYIQFTKMTSNVCSSYVGRYGWPAQPVYVGPNCSVGNIIHEIGHAVGLYHEQGRGDRNLYINVLTANIVSSQQYNYNLNLGTDMVYFGYNSVMMYPATGNSVNGKPTIETVPAGIPIGQRIGLDSSDIAAVKEMYGIPSSTVALGSTPPGNTLTVDGVPLVTPSNPAWLAGSSHTVSAPASVPASGTSIYEFVRWSDGGAPAHTVTVGSSGLVLSATYALRHLVSATANPAGAGTVTVSGPMVNGYFPDLSYADLLATHSAGYCFNTWTGITASAPAQAKPLVTRSLTVRANFITGAVTPAATTVSLPPTAGTHSLLATGSTGCSWVVTTTAPWINIPVIGATSSAPNTSYTVQANTTGLPRTAIITVDGQPVTVTQLAQ